MKTSHTVAIHSRALQKIQSGEKVYNFAAGDPVVPSNSEVIEKVIAEIKNEQIVYAPVAGLSDLRQAAATWVNEEYACNYTLENILVTTGGKFALFAAMQVLLKEGDEVLIPSPYWISYAEIAKLFKSIPVIVQTQENDWKLTPDQLKAQLTKKSKILVLNNPGNPTGALYTKEELEELLAVAKEANLFVIADEVYSELVYEGQFCSCGAIKNGPEVLVVQSCSKNFAMTGWRIGFACGPPRIIAAMTAIQSHSTTGACIVSQWAAIAALKNRKKITDHLRQTMKARRDVFFETFNQLFSCNLKKPKAGLYAFVPLKVFNISSSSAEFCTELLEKFNIACIPGSAFGQQGYVRMAFVDHEEQIRAGLFALKNCF